MMKIRILLNGDTTAVYSLKDGQKILKNLEPSNLILDETTNTPVSADNVSEEGQYTVIPHVAGG